MVSELERLMARVIAQAVNFESEVFSDIKRIGGIYIPPKWYQPAVEALAAYDQKAQEQRHEQY